MILILVCAGLAVWVFYMGLKFYHAADWEEAPKPSPDFGAMRKREAELLHIQEVLQMAHEEGKLPRGFVDEYNRFCDGEIAKMRAAQKAWEDRRPSRSSATKPPRDPPEL